MKIEFLESIKKRDPSAQNYLEIILCYPGFHAIIFHRICHFLDKINIPILPRFLANISRILTGIEIHPKAKIGKNLFIDHGHGVVIGETSVIGNNVTIYQGVTLGGKTLNKVKRHPTIGDNVVIGAGTKIIGNIIISNKVKIGPACLILENLPSEKTFVAKSFYEDKKNNQQETLNFMI